MNVVGLGAADLSAAAILRRYIMFGARWRLFRLLGIPISVDASWLIILALIVWSLSGIFHEQYPELHAVNYWVMGAVTALAFFACIVLHELGHAVVARSFGMPIRGITLFLFGGVAELEGEPPSAHSEFLMAAAGPFVSLILAVLFGSLAMVGNASGWTAEVVGVLAYLGWINGTVLVFNLIPAFPLDGGRVFRSILWGVTGNLRRSTRWASLVGRGFAFVLIALGVAQFFFGNMVGGIWTALIGLFLNNAARSSYQQIVVQEALRGEPVRLFMNREPIFVPPSLDLRHLVEDYMYRYHRKVFPVASDGHLEGIVSTRDLSKYPREEWPRHTVGEVMEHDLASATIPPDADALQALSKMQRTGRSRLLVTDGDHLVGIVSLKDLLRFLDQKIELQGGVG
jgi:Zn-dependent protease/CBS domain-containing protein